jgi:hypothetical protein
MTTRRRTLPPGWYPDTPAETRAAIKEYLDELPATDVKEAAAVVAPHAGWEFSGRTALEAIRCLPSDLETVVVVGGHLSPSDPVMVAGEDELETPLGNISSDGDLLFALRKILPLQTDRQADNTVEIQLPFVKYLLPRARALYLRAPPSLEAIRLGQAVASAARALSRKTAVLGSTDLTHYGANYGFTPAGKGERALSWVREVNDREFIDRLLAMDAEGALDHAEESRSACSAGGAVAALAFGRSRGVKQGTLIRYMTSSDVYPGESFVGYAGIAFAPRAD